MKRDIVIVETADGGRVVGDDVDVEVSDQLSASVAALVDRLNRGGPVAKERPKSK